MIETIRKAKEQLQNGDMKAIAKESGIPYQILYKVLNGGKSTRQTEIITAVTNFLQERKTELERLESALN